MQIQEKETKQPKHSHLCFRYYNIYTMLQLQFACFFFFKTEWLKDQAYWLYISSSQHHSCRPILGTLLYIYIFFYHEVFSFSQSNLEMTVFEWKFPPVFLSPVFHHLFCPLDLYKCNEGDLLTPFYKNGLPWWLRW